MGFLLINDPVNFADPDGRFGKAVFQGATKGDFYDPTNTAETWGKGIGQIAAGLVPYYGQAADIRDMGAALNTARTEGVNWRTGVGVAMAGVAFVPGLGDAARSIVKPIINTASPHADKAAAGVKALHASGSYFFKGDQAIAHFEKHSNSIMKAMGQSSYNLAQYVSDANHIVKSGTYVPELNAYVKLIGGQGAAKFGIVGMERGTSTITTFHIKTVSELARKAPSLGITY